MGNIKEVNIKNRTYCFFDDIVNTFVFYKIKTSASTDKNRKVLKKYAKLWDEIKYHIQTINAGKSGKCNSIHMKKIT